MPTLLAVHPIHVRSKTNYYVTMVMTEPSAYKVSVIEHYSYEIIDVDILIIAIQINSQILKVNCSMDFILSKLLT